GLDLRPLFDLYLRQPALPQLVAERDGRRLQLRWETPEGYPLELPVEVAVDGARRTVAMEGGTGTLRLPTGAEVRLDPDDWILKAE
ncbi:MAG: M1 family peptidase, partial [Rhodothermales bacterium]|nr:M1 family peptidase [Rhodothermales bacterium]